MQRFNGTYFVKYAGEFGSGHGQLTIDNGRISGRDVTGTDFSGTGTLETDALKIDMAMHQTGRPGVNVMTGAHMGQGLKFSFELPEDFAERDHVMAETSAGPLILKFKKM